MKIKYKTMTKATDLINWRAFSRLCGVSASAYRGDRIPKNEEHKKLRADLLAAAEKAIAKTPDNK